MSGESRRLPALRGTELLPGDRRTVWPGFAAGRGRTSNALSKTPMARPRKKGRWLDHAQAMIEGKGLGRVFS